MDFLKLVKARYSCRKFSAKPIEDDKLNRILDAGIYAPTAKNAQPVKIWVFQSPEALAKINTATPFTWAHTAQAIIAVGGTHEGAFVRPSDNRNFEDVDACIVATHIMLAVQAEGLGTTWIGMFDSPKVKELFPQTEGYDLVALFPIGYPAEDASPSDRHEVRKAREDLVQYV